MARRGENIYKRKDGRWEGRFIKSRRPDNSIRYGYIYARTYKEVKIKLFEKKYQYKTQVKKEVKFKGTMKQWIDIWLDGALASKVKPSTYASYQYKLQQYVSSEIGEVPLVEVTQETIQKLVDRLSDRGLSAYTIRTVIQILKHSLSDALNYQYLLKNPVFDIVFPRQLRKKVSALTKNEQTRLEKSAMTSKNGVSVMLALHTGLRIGEISALKWEDIDLEKKELSVSRTLQRILSSRKGRKTEISIGLAKSVSGYRKIPLNKKICEILKNKKKAATSPYVVGENNRYFEPRTLSYQFKKILKRANLANLHFHQLRHTFATRLLEIGADVVSVSALLGHRSAKMTLDIYVDSMMTQRKKWVSRLV